ncbi:hypothetical protein ACFQ44_02030 [Levilactobacillus lanxiensis]|jgi:uncharacterized membrane protein HdeD (DUF308 family)|uniref:Uncharacterized protein n=1 Tax=Levilactobacillus lanxiensis TaxID=2799568 RepID=A0ABW4D3C2_9LACO|nr:MULTISPECIES: hypothetical protein [Levilactobacillus]
MFTTIFWILAIWLVVNGVWTCFATDNQELMKWFGWINVIAIILGFWVFYGAASVAVLVGWFTAVNWVNVVLAIIQLVLAYRKVGSTHNA